MGAIEEASSRAGEEREDAPAKAPGREVLGLLLIALSGFVAASLITYPGLGEAGNILGDNAMGPVGNGVARWSLAAVGLGIYPIVLMVAVVGFRLLLRRTLRFRPGLLLGGLSWAVSLAVIFHVAFVGRTVHGAHLAGGATGELLGEVLCSLVSEAGTYLVAGVAILATAVLVTSLSLSTCLRAVVSAGRWLGRLGVGALDRLGARVIRLAERWDRPVVAAEEEALAPLVKTPAFVEEEGEEGDEDEAVATAGAEAGSARAGAKPKVSKEKRKAEPPTEALDIRPLPDLEGWELPPLTLLDKLERDEAKVDEAALQATAKRLVDALTDYGVTGSVTEIHPGPVVTLFEYVPQSGTKLSKISGLRDELAMRLEVERVRIVAPIPGKNAVGFEIPNPTRAAVGLREVLAHQLATDKKAKLPLALGRDIGGGPYGVDLGKMPHLIVAGTTGSGKSVCVNALLLSLLFRFPPKDLRLILIDPKEVELGGYDDIPHLLVPVVVDMRKAASALKWAVDEMERRYDLFARLRVRNLEGYNKKAPTVLAAEAAGREAMLEGDDEPVIIPDADPIPERLPYIVIVLDELADLMMVAAREVETAIARLAQKARAAGIHLVVATQRPSTDVMSGTIRNNFPARISFRVATGIDSRTVLDTQGAESLLGAGDMLVRPPGTSDLVRVHGAYVSDEEVLRVVDHLKGQGRPVYEEAVLTMPDESGGAVEGDEDKSNEQYDLAVALVAREQRASVSFIQRHLRIGYNTAARLMERLEKEGVVGPERGSRPREVLIQPR